MECEDGKNYRIPTDLGLAYLWLGDTSAQITVAYENRPDNMQLRATTEAICRLASKAMKVGLPMLDIAEQLRRADSGRFGLLSAIAAKMEEYQKGETM